MTGAIFRDRVLNEKGENIGVSFGRQNSAYFHRMISIYCLDSEYAKLGTEVYVLWGDPGKRKKKIRAKVTRFPYNNVLRNESTDVSKLPKAEKNSYEKISLFIKSIYYPERYVSDTPTGLTYPDEYGGSIENRAKFPLQVLKAVREKIGNDMVIEIRISGDEHQEGGWSIEGGTKRPFGRRAAFYGY